MLNRPLFEEVLIGELGLVILLGRHGTRKSESVKLALNVPQPLGDHGEATSGGRALHRRPHAPFGLYRQLWNCRNKPIVLDDLDRFYADPDCVRLLKPLCNTLREKRLTWLTNLTINDGRFLPRSPQRAT